MTYSPQSTSTHPAWPREEEEDWEKEGAHELLALARIDPVFRRQALYIFRGVRQESHDLRQFARRCLHLWLRMWVVSEMPLMLSS